MGHEVTLFTLLALSVKQRLSYELRNDDTMTSHTRDIILKVIFLVYTGKRCTERGVRFQLCNSGGLEVEGLHDDMMQCLG